MPASPLVIDSAQSVIASRMFDGSKRGSRPGGWIRVDGKQYMVKMCQGTRADRCELVASEAMKAMPLIGYDVTPTPWAPWVIIDHVENENDVSVCGVWGNYTRKAMQHESAVRDACYMIALDYVFDNQDRNEGNALAVTDANGDMRIVPVDNELMYAIGRWDSPYNEWPMPYVVSTGRAITQVLHVADREAIVRDTCQRVAHVFEVEGINRRCLEWTWANARNVAERMT